MTSLIEKLRQIAEAKVGDPMPECMKGPIPEAALCSIAHQAVEALEAAEAARLVIPLMPRDIIGDVFIGAWRPIETAPVEPFDPKVTWKRFPCLLQLEKGYVCEGWAYWVPPRRTSQLPILRWANYMGQCQPVAWMPLPEASLEHARSKP